MCVEHGFNGVFVAVENDGCEVFGLDVFDELAELDDELVRVRTGERGTDAL